MALLLPRPVAGTGSATGREIDDDERAALGVSKQAAWERFSGED